MSKQDDRPAAEVFSIIEEPTAQAGPIKTILLKAMTALGGHPIPAGTHPVVVVKETGQTVKAAVAATAFAENMQEDLWKLTAGEFRNRYLDL